MPSPLDWNFYATDSSIIFKLEPSDEHPYWVEAHGHFGRFGTVPICVMITSHRRGLGEGIEFLEAVLTDLFWKRLPSFFRQRGPGIGIELQPSIYYFGIRLQCDVLAYDNPKRLDLPAQARLQVEQILGRLSQEELSTTATGADAQPNSRRRSRRKTRSTSSPTTSPTTSPTKAPAKVPAQTVSSPAKNVSAPPAVEVKPPVTHSSVATDSSVTHPLEPNPWDDVPQREPALSI